MKSESYLPALRCSRSKSRFWKGKKKRSAGELARLQPTFYIPSPKKPHQNHKRVKGNQKRGFSNKNKLLIQVTWNNYSNENHNQKKFYNVYPNLEV